MGQLVEIVQGPAKLVNEGTQGDARIGHFVPARRTMSGIRGGGPLRLVERRSTRWRTEPVPRGRRYSSPVSMFVESMPLARSSGTRWVMLSPSMTIGLSANPCLRAAPIVPPHGRRVHPAGVGDRLDLSDAESHRATDPLAARSPAHSRYADRGHVASEECSWLISARKSIVT